MLPNLVRPTKTAELDVDGLHEVVTPGKATERRPGAVGQHGQSMATGKTMALAREHEHRRGHGKERVGAQPDSRGRG